MINIIHETLCCINEIIKTSLQKEDVGADDIFPCFIYVVIQSDVSGFFFSLCY